MAPGLCGQGGPQPRGGQAGLPGALREGRGTWPEWLGGWEVGGRGYARSLPRRYLPELWACTPLSHLRNNQGAHERLQIVKNYFVPEGQ